MSREKLNEIRDKLKKSGVKITQQRLVIYDALMNVKHPDADEIYKYVRKRNPSISLATVYKTLETFVELGLILKVKTAQDKVQYDANIEPHHHLYCKKTDKIIDYEDEGLKKVLQNYFKKKKIRNFKIDSIQLQINGEIKEVE